MKYDLRPDQRARQGPSLNNQIHNRAPITIPKLVSTLTALILKRAKSSNNFLRRNSFLVSVLQVCETFNILKEQAFSQETLISFLYRY